MAVTPTTVEATYDGQAIWPDEPIQLPPNTRVVVTIAPAETPEDKAGLFLKTALSLRLEGPPDWSERLEDYLYGHKTNAGE